MIGDFFERLGRKIGASGARKKTAPHARPFENDPELEEKLKRHIQEHLDRTGRMPVVSLEEFFQGNGDVGSIGCNLTRHPGIGVFAGTLTALRDLPEVQDVLIGITDFEPETNGIWPFSEIVYVLTTLAPEDVARRIKVLDPDSVYGAPNTVPPSHDTLPMLKPGHKLLTAWWD